MSTNIASCTSTSPDMTRALGNALATHCIAGDVIMLSGDLGAGKTTFTQGLGEGLHVRGIVASPTFIISRVHPPQKPSGLALIHTDAYRITSIDDLETLDLDSTLDEAVTVIEWGEGKTEGLSTDRLEISIKKSEGAAMHINADGSVNLEDADDGQRYFEFKACSSRWDVSALQFLCDTVTDHTTTAGDGAGTTTDHTTTAGDGAGTTTDHTTTASDHTTTNKGKEK